MRSVRSCNVRRRRILSTPANREEMTVVVIPALSPKWPVFVRIGGRLKRHTPKHAEWVYAMLAQAAEKAAAKPKPKRSHHKKAPAAEVAA